MDISVIIPAFNEAATISEIIKATKKFSEDILVVISKNNTDTTKEKAEGLGARVIYDTGKGKGEALRLGSNAAKNEILLFIDADGSHDPNDIPKLIRPIQTKECSFVIGSRTRGGSDELHGTFTESFRNMGGAFIMLLINCRFKTVLTDCENGFRAIKKEIFNNLNLKANDFDIEQEMVIKALKHGMSIKEVPTHEYRRKKGVSRLRLSRCGWKFIWRLKDCFF